jgi:hypothetical protein
LNTIGKLGDNLRLGIQFLARDLGDAGNDEMKVDWAFGDYRYRNWLGIQVGKLRRALALYNQSRDVDAARTGIFLPLSVYNENLRAVQEAIKGVGLYGILPGGLEYQIQYGSLGSDWERSLLESSNVENAQANDDSYVLYLTWNTPLDGLKLVGRYDYMRWFQDSVQGETTMEFEFDRDGWLVGTEYTYGDLTLAAEYAQVMFEMNEINNGWTYDFTIEVYYGLVTYRFTDWFELGSSYAVSYGNKDDKDGDQFAAQGTPRAQAWAKDLALSARFDLSESWIVKLEGHWINGLYEVSNYGDDPDENGFLGAAKVTFSF